MLSNLLPGRLSWTRCGAIVSSLIFLGVNYPVHAKESPKDSESIQFQLVPARQTIIPCVAAPGKNPKVTVTVKRGDLNDTMTVHAEGFKSGIQFDLFTIQNSPFLSNGQPDPNFKGFGLSWYQTDLEPGSVTIRTILLDQIFGFVSTNPQSASPLQPTRTFHVGFWFNNPDDAVACNPNHQRIVTPFNGEFQAGPLAFISLPDPVSKLGPLCTKPNPNVPGGCDP